MTQQLVKAGVRQCEDLTTEEALELWRITNQHIKTTVRNVAEFASALATRRSLINQIRYQAQRKDLTTEEALQLWRITNQQIKALTAQAA